MKKFIFTLSFVAALSLSTVSCSTDDSALNNDANAAELSLSNSLSTSTTITLDNGDKDLPKPPMKN